MLRLSLWPHQSLPPVGFVWAIGVALAVISLPLLALVGTAALWGILPFALGAVGILWLALKRSWRDRRILETFALTRERASLRREAANEAAREWEANPYWVRVELRHEGGPVEDYVTLEGGPRAVEIGAFLTPSERRELAAVLREGLRAAKA
ncbi:DUF2244 domain-containing protein [Jannaschia sp. W003]|uniref:DUF2244 domain-containing protein n=1 Tax=Jannaschia sp. W003 TaxID=2867012 RepID=UPI0021A43D86|nr:DUF2244 domain-containing protein [Jannaschia sp. W003]UWQ20328.1 DUF2244 domain-containing protein [Jannaschia sp. W003]